MSEIPIRPPMTPIIIKDKDEIIENWFRTATPAQYKKIGEWLSEANKALGGKTNE